MSKEMGELQRRWAVVMESVRTNSHVVAFMNSRIGQYLDTHPFVALSLLIFMAISAIPVAFFLAFVVATTAVACIALLVMEGFIVSLGGLALLCVLGGLATLSLAVSGTLSVGYVSLTTLLSYWPTPDRLSKKEIANGRDCSPSCPPALTEDGIKKNSK